MLGNWHHTPAPQGRAAPRETETLLEHPQLPGNRVQVQLWRAGPGRAEPTCQRAPGAAPRRTWRARCRLSPAAMLFTEHRGIAPSAPRGEGARSWLTARGREPCSSLRGSKKHPDGQGQSPCPTSPCQFRPDSPALRPVAVPGPGPSMSRSPTVREGTRPGRCFGEAAAQSRSCRSEGHVVGLAARPSHGGRPGLGEPACFSRTLSAPLGASGSRGLRSGQEGWRRLG